MRRRHPAPRPVPGGNVTFLFTDIEGSTGLKRLHGDEAYASMEQRHREILQQAVEEHEGVFVDAKGDGCTFVFSSARSAIAACIESQRALAAEPWPSGNTVPVRMGLHTGEARFINGAFTGTAVAAAARIGDAANGDQIVASQATVTVSLEALPSGTSLKDLGDYILKDFENTPMRLYQVCHEDLSRWDFPPLRRANQPRSRPDAKVERVTCYRSPATPFGAFRRPGDIHVHIDGGPNTGAIFDALRELEGATTGDEPPLFPMKFNEIRGFSAGPQREERAFVQTYRSHTPGTVQRERFDSFSTMLLGSDLDAGAVDALAAILEKMQDWPGAVVELERVIGVLTPGAKWEEADPPRIADPSAFDTGPLHDHPRLATSSIEIHHSIDFPKQAGDEVPILEVDQMPKWDYLGGWFLFDKGDTWSYRSSEFVDRSGDFRFLAKIGQNRLLSFLKNVNRGYELHTLAEQVLGIWRGGAQPTDERSSVPALSEWEMSCPPGGEIWVIAPNFFGDRSPDVRRAMMRNLCQRVTYTYFLHSYADVLRLSNLARDLERLLMNDGGMTTDAAGRAVARGIRCIVLDRHAGESDRLRTLLADDYFVCPSHPEEMGGYRLDSSGFSGERLDTDEYEDLVGTLSPIVNSKIGELFASKEGAWVSHSTHRTLVCTDLQGLAAEHDQDSWRAMLRAYDAIVAAKVSMHGGTGIVVRPVRNGYLLVFEDPKEAGLWARRLQFELEYQNDIIAKRGGLQIPTHSISLGYGSVTRLLRAHGYDYVGGAIDECIRLANALRGGQIGMSRMFADQYAERVGRQEFEATTRIEKDFLLDEVRLLDWP